MYVGERERERFLTEGWLYVSVCACMVIFVSGMGQMF